MNLISLLVPLLVVFATSSDDAQAKVPVSLSGPNAVTGENVKLKPGEEDLVVVFLSSICPCSIGHEKTITELQKQYGEKFKFVGVHSNTNEPEAEAKAHFGRAPLGFPVIRDAGAKIADEWGALKTPHAFVVQKGEIVFQGGVDDSTDPARAKNHYLKDALAAISAGKKPENAKARALGCVIQR